MQSSMWNNIIYKKLALRNIIYNSRTFSTWSLISLFKNKRKKQNQRKLIHRPNWLHSFVYEIKYVMLQIAALSLFQFNCFQQHKKIVVNWISWKHRIMIEQTCLWITLRSSSAFSVRFDKLVESVSSKCFP